MIYRTVDTTGRVELGIEVGELDERQFMAEKEYESPAVKHQVILPVYITEAQAERFLREVEK